MFGRARAAAAWLAAALFLCPSLVADELDDLIKQLEEPDYQKRNAVEDQIKAILKPGDLPRLEAAIGKEYKVSHYSLVQLIESIPGEPAKEALRRILRDKDGTTAYYAFLSLSRIKDAWATEYVLGLLADEKVPDDKKTNLVNALYSVPDDRALPVLRRLVEISKAEYIRTRAIQILADRKDGGSLDLFKRLASDDKENESVRGAAAVALIRLGDESGKALVKQRIREGKLQYIDLIGLTGALGTKEKAEEYFEDLRALLVSTKEIAIKTHLIDFLARMGDVKLLDKIETFLESEEEGVAEAAARAVLALGQSAEGLKKYLVSPETRTRLKVEVAGALLLFDDFDGLGLLVEASSNGDVAVRRSAVSHLGNARVDEAIEPLVARLSDPDSTVRTYAFQALRETFSTLLPYRPFDWERLGYDAATPDAAKDAAAQQILREFWARNK
ncbi:MAG: HEAT repeat domain-containing protein [Planctomycetes bacterium]|nr:HEAT repeat domain-containing protein [Planctomycetota bacterium]